MPEIFSNHEQQKKEKQGNIIFFKNFKNNWLSTALITESLHLLWYRKLIYKDDIAINNNGVSIWLDGNTMHMNCNRYTIGKHVLYGEEWQIYILWVIKSCKKLGIWRVCIFNIERKTDV